jgi:hypothetical protein
MATKVRLPRFSKSPVILCSIVWKSTQLSNGDRLVILRYRGHLDTQCGVTASFFATFLSLYVFLFMVMAKKIAAFTLIS